MELSGKVVVITGASSGIGAATASHLAGLGARVVLGARRAARLEALAADIHQAGGEALWQETDVTKRDQVRALVELAVQRYGRLDVLINNAGLMAVGSIHKLAVDEWERMVDINLKGVLHGVAAAMPIFQQQQAGHLINLGSLASHKVAPGGAVYSATKFAVRALTEGLRQECPNIRCSLISPGAIATELPYGSSDERTVRALEQAYQTALPAESVAQTIAWTLAQPAAVDINEIIIRPTVQPF